MQPANGLGSGNANPVWSPQQVTPIVPGFSQIIPELPSLGAGLGRVGGGEASGEYERTMIEALCEPVGLKVVPPEDKLQSFLQVNS